MEKVLEEQIKEAVKGQYIFYKGTEFNIVSEPIVDKDGDEYYVTCNAQGRMWTEDGEEDIDAEVIFKVKVVADALLIHQEEINC